VELSSFLNNVALTLENLIGSQLQKGQYRLGFIDLQNLSEIQPLNQKFEILISRCKSCGNATAFLSLQQLDHYLDIEKQSILECRHCQFKVQIPKIHQIREKQGKIYNFLQVQDWQFTKIISKKGRILTISKQERKIQLQYEDQNRNKTIVVEIPKNKAKLLSKLQIQGLYRFKAKIFISKIIDPKQSFLTQLKKGSPTLIPSYKYELISIFPEIA